MLLRATRTSARRSRNNTGSLSKLLSDGRPLSSMQKARDASTCNSNDWPASTVSKMRFRRAISSLAGTDKVEPSADGARVWTSALCIHLRPLAGISSAFRKSFSASRADATMRQHAATARQAATRPNVVLAGDFARR